MGHGDKEEGGGEANLDSRRRILEGGDVSFSAGDIFCGDEIGRITVHNAINLAYKRSRSVPSFPNSSILPARLWASWKVSNSCSASFASLSLCWETKTGFVPAISLAGSLNLSSCDVFAGGGPCIECSEGSKLWATRNRIGGFGTGPRPSATVGVVAWGGESRCSVSLVDCRFQNIVNHAVRMYKMSSGEIKGCSLVNCGKSIMKDVDANVVVEERE
uniref:Uncharacterized protein n=1 Tax=Guillardia theta TaxID=55529 RepID=A0A7S4NUI7_GUITH|mmetsp:Transcript_34684/g.108582  ORF Transcript_34684/g.108582 Transcript_34684/m.108582 type:complete len:217 (+) Transcript_34684:3-653(+)